MNTTRRQWLARASVAAAGLSITPAFAKRKAATPEPVVVLTAYAEEVLTRFEAAFEHAYPQHRLQLVWRMPHDALPYLADGNTHGVDVLWMASPRTFVELKRQGLWTPLILDRAGLPPKIGGTTISDPDGQFLATEVAAYGFAINPAALTRLGLGVPTDWTDLLDTRYAGQIAMPIPSQVGFAPVMYDIILQAWSWDAGWALLSELAGNAVLTGRGANFVTDEVATGRAAVGLSIDFFVASAIANGAPLRFVYPQHSGINPGHIAIPHNAPHPRGAQDFVNFILSDAGQHLLTTPDIRKLPVRPSAYENLPRSDYRPFEAAAKGGLGYDNDAGQAGLGLIAGLFDAMITANHAQLVSLWQRIHAAEKVGKPVTQARQWLTQAPLTHEEAKLPALQRAFKRLEGAAPTEPSQQTQWRERCQATRLQAQRFLDGAGA